MRMEERREKGRTRFKHIRERWCLKNNHAEGVEMVEGRQKCETEKVGAEKERERERERGGGSGSTTGAINSSGGGGGRYRFNCNYFGITAG